MPATDRYGLGLTTHSEDALTSYVEGVDRQLSLGAGAEQALRAAVAADPELAVAHAALGFSLAFAGRTADALAALGEARRRAERATRRERQHVEAMAFAVEDGGPWALALLDEHLEQFPRDALVLYQAALLASFGGGRQPREAAFERYRRRASAYGDDWWFLGAFSFAHHELGLLEESWRLGQRSLDGHPGNGGAAHSLVHVAYERGDHNGGTAFLDSWLDRYSPAALYHCHFHWHLALHQLAQGDADAALGTYAEFIGPALASAPTGLADGASLLWRAQLYGHGERSTLAWNTVADEAAERAASPGSAFEAVHLAMALAAVGDGAGLERLTLGLGTLDSSMRRLTLATVEGVAAAGRSDWAGAIRWLEPVMADVVRLGGSNLQREVFEDTLLVAYLRDGRGELGAALLEQRLLRRPSAQDARWLAVARSCPPGAAAHAAPMA